VQKLGTITMQKCFLEAKNHELQQCHLNTKSGHHKNVYVKGKITSLNKT